MTTFGRSDELRGARFRGADLREARFRGVDLRDARIEESVLSGVVMRGVEVARVDIDAPWLPHGGFLSVNGVDVIPFVEAELDRRFPGRELRRAADPAGLREAWAALERAWTAVRERAEAMPPGTVDASVDGEWSFVQTLRHLVHATDVWLNKAVLGQEQPFHPLGLADAGSAHDAPAPADSPAYADVLEARADRVAEVRDLLAAVTPEELATPRRNPHEPAEPETTLSCLQVILEEEWEHLRFATRDLDTLASS